MRICDISISRQHAELRAINGEYYLCDTEAKFGTLVQLQKATRLRTDRTLRVQAGRTLMEFSVKLPFCARFHGEEYPIEPSHRYRQQPELSESFETPTNEQLVVQAHKTEADLSWPGRVNEFSQAK